MIQKRPQMTLLTDYGMIVAWRLFENSEPPQYRTHQLAQFGKAPGADPAALQASGRRLIDGNIYMKFEDAASGNPQIWL